jgi:hypothetical protein
MQTNVPLLLIVLGNEEEIFIDVAYDKLPDGKIQINHITYGETDIDELLNPVQVDAIRALILEGEDV